MTSPAANWCHQIEALLNYFQSRGTLTTILSDVGRNIGCSHATAIIADEVAVSPSYHIFGNQDERERQSVAIMEYIESDLHENPWKCVLPDHPIVNTLYT